MTGGSNSRCYAGVVLLCVLFRIANFSRDNMLFKFKVVGFLLNGRDSIKQAMLRLCQKAIRAVTEI